MRYPWYLRLIAWVGNQEPVWLEDFEGGYYASIAFISPFGKKVAYVYPITRIGIKTLQPDGTVHNSHIERWKHA